MLSSHAVNQLQRHRHGIIAHPHHDTSKPCNLNLHKSMALSPGLQLLLNLLFNALGGILEILSQALDGAFGSFDGLLI